MERLILKLNVNIYIHFKFLDILKIYLVALYGVFQKIFFYPLNNSEFLRKQVNI